MGFDGEQKISSLVRGVRAASSCSSVTRKPLVTSVFTTTVRAPTIATGSG